MERPPGLATVGLDRDAVDICDEAAIVAALRDHRPEAIINAAAYTGVDKAEGEPDQAFRVNRDGAAALATAAAAASIPMVHISTDYVFDGTKRTPYTEHDAVIPQSVYGLSKAEGERAVREACSSHVIVRTAWVYSPYGTNFLRTMLRLAAERDALHVVDDQVGTPTAAADVATALLAIIAKALNPDFSAWGTYHYRGADIVTWYGFAQRIFGEARRLGYPTAQLVPIVTAQYPTPAHRPPYSVLDITKIEGVFGIQPRPLQQGIRDCLLRSKERESSKIVT